VRAAESDAETAALADIVARHLRRCKALSALRRPGIGQGGTRIGFSGSARRRSIALVEPGGEETAVCGIERQCFEALAGAVAGNRLGAEKLAPPSTERLIMTRPL
jgi:hypothetical protein